MSRTASGRNRTTAADPSTFDWATRRARDGARTIVGLSLGAAVALLEFVYLLLTGLVLLLVWLWPVARKFVVDLGLAGSRWLADLERQRLVRFLGQDGLATPTPNRRTLRYTAVRWLIGLFGGLVLLLLAMGVVIGGILLWRIAAPLLGYSTSRDESSWFNLVWAIVLGLVLLFLNLQGISAVANLDRRLARHLLGPDPREQLERRIKELATSRAGVVAAVDSERRRIERDLHDGVQQRLVALGVLIGRARRARDQERVAELLAEAHRESESVLSDLRDVAWRIYPAALDNNGLSEAISTVADRATLPVRVHYDVPGELPPTTETAAYFVVSEAVTNAIKHAKADLVTVRVWRHENMMSVRVIDNGVGGADPEGGGLGGLARRVAALDGTFGVTSPAGGPTVIAAELPCG